jgi:hypothetical protein
MRLRLVGNQFDVIVDGDQRYREGTYRDTMDDDCWTLYRWFEGSGKVIEKASGKETPFILRSRDVELGGIQTLQEHVFSHNSPSLAEKPLSEIMLSGREPYLVDLIAQQALMEIATDTRNVIPHCRLGGLDYNFLIAHGIIPSWDGTVTLPGLAATTSAA